MLSQFIALSALVANAAALPLVTRQSPTKPFVLPVPEEGPGPTFDATATRVAANVHIRSVASPDTCFDVSDFEAGDFRFNLVPVALQRCDSQNPGQKFDLITRGEHNDVADESRVIIVSSQQLTCIDRRSNKNDRQRPGLFACGGRAVGDGETSTDQQFFFNKAAGVSGEITFPIVRDSVNNGVGPGNQCMSFDRDGFLRNTPCDTLNPTPEQRWIVETFDGGASTPAPAPAPAPAPEQEPETTSPSGSLPVTSTVTEAPTVSSTNPTETTLPTVPEDCQQQPVVTRTVTVTAPAGTSTSTGENTSTSTPVPVPTSSSSSTSTSSVPVPIVTPSSTPGTPTPTSRPETFVLPTPGREGPGPVFDETATRAATAAQIRNAANPELCFDVSDFRAGDSRFNKVPLALKPCDSTVEGQKFDLITKGVYNNVADGSRTIIVSSQQLTCVDRVASKSTNGEPGLFTCGGRAAGDGETSFNQQFFFDQTADLSQGIAFVSVQGSRNNGVGAGNSCLTADSSGFLRNAPCAPKDVAPEQLWIVG